MTYLINVSSGHPKVVSDNFLLNQNRFNWKLSKPKFNIYKFEKITRVKVNSETQEVLENFLDVASRIMHDSKLLWDSMYIRHLIYEYIWTNFKDMKNMPIPIYGVIYNYFSTNSYKNLLLTITHFFNPRKKTADINYSNLKKCIKNILPFEEFKKTFGFIDKAIKDSDVLRKNRE